MKFGIGTKIYTASSILVCIGQS